VIFSLKNPEPENNQSLGIYLINTLKSLNNVKVIGLLLINILVFIILYGALLTYFPILLGGKFHAAPYLIGLIMSSASMSAAVISTQVGRLARLFPQKKMLIVAISLFGIAVGIIPWMPSLWMLLVPAVFWGIAQGINTPVLQTMLVGLAPIDYRAAFMSVNGMILRLGQTLGPLIMGALYVLWGFRGAFLGAAGVVVVMLIILITMIKVKDEQSEKSRMA
jgi:MFS family permease